MTVVELNPDDARALGVEAGDIVELYNDYGSTYAIAYPDKSLKRDHTFMQFGGYNGFVGDEVTTWTDRHFIPYYNKGTWADIRRVGGGEHFRMTVSFKSRRYELA